MVMITTIIRVIGLPACIVITLLVFYEGLPGAYRIPFLSSVPVLGDIATGRVHSHAAHQVRLATAGLVARSELTAARAQLARERELRQAAHDAEIQARLRSMAADRAKADAEARYQALIDADTGEDGATWTEGDIRWLAQ